MSTHLSKPPCRIEMIAAYIDGELSEDACSQLEEHIKECASCGSELSRQRQLLCTLDSAFGRGSDLFLPTDFARTIAARAESDMSGMRERAEHKRAFGLSVLLAVAAFTLLGVASRDLVFSLARTIVGHVSGVLDLVWTTIYDAIAGVAVISRVLSKGFIPESHLTGFIEFLLLAVAVALLSRLIARYHRTRLLE
jgi:predicted anti-sigma-YlaC factor YlaD